MNMDMSQVICVCNCINIPVALNYIYLSLFTEEKSIFSHSPNKRLLIFSVIFNISSPSASLYGVSGTGTRNSYISHSGLWNLLVYIRCMCSIIKHGNSVCISTSSLHDYYLIIAQSTTIGFVYHNCGSIILHHKCLYFYSTSIYNFTRGNYLNMSHLKYD